MKVLCIDDFWYHDYIKEGEEYEVLSLDVDELVVELDIYMPFRVFDIDRFKFPDIDINEVKRLKEIAEEIEEHEDAISHLESGSYRIKGRLEDMWVKIKWFFTRESSN